MKPPREVSKNGKRQWLADLREIGGGRHYFKTQTAAQRFQSESLDEHAKHGAVAFDLPHDTRLRYLAADRRAAELGCTIEQALDWFEQTHRPMESKRLGEAIEACLAAKRAANKRPRYVEQFGYALESFAKSAGGETLCSDVTAEHIEKWLNNPDWGARTRAGKLIDVRTFFSFCKRSQRKWVLANPADDVEPILVDAKRPGILTVAHVQALFDTCLEVEPKLMPWLVLGIFCGVRPDEIKQLTWGLVHLDRALVDIPPEISKVRRRARFIPIQFNALAWLEATQAKGDLPPTNWRRRWQRVRAKAGFKIDEKKGKGVPWPHDAMRHTFCSYAMPIFGAAKTADWHGDDEDTMIEHYRERVTEDEARKFWAIVPRETPHKSRRRRARRVV